MPHDEPPSIPEQGRPEQHGPEMDDTQVEATGAFRDQLDEAGQQQGQEQGQQDGQEQDQQDTARPERA